MVDLHVYCSITWSFCSITYDYVVWLALNDEGMMLNNRIYRDHPKNDSNNSSESYNKRGWVDNCTIEYTLLYNNMVHAYYNMTWHMHIVT